MRDFGTLLVTKVSLAKSAAAPSRLEPAFPALPPCVGWEKRKLPPWPRQPAGRLPNPAEFGS